MNEVTPDVEALRKHRFRLTHESAHLLNLARTSFQEYISQHPEIVGITVYGSQVKGRARSENHPEGKSDIDGYFFIDEDLAGLEPDDQVHRLSSDNSRNRITMAETTGKNFHAHLAAALGYSSDELKDFRLKLVSKEIIDTEIMAMRRYLEEIEASEQGQGPRPAFETRPQSDMTTMFHLQIGKNLDPYRKYVLNALQNMGSIGDRIWEDFFYQTELSRESGKLVKGISDEAIQFSIDRTALFPHTVDDAIKYFQLDNTQPKYGLASEKVV